MASFFKLIGTPNDPWIGHYHFDYVRFSRSPKSINVGDHLILYACGGSKRIFADAAIIGTAYLVAGDGRWPYRMNVTFVVNVLPADGILLAEVNVGRNLQNCVRAPYFRLTDEEFDQASALLAGAAQ